MEALLSKDPITTCLYRRKSDGKFLVCKSKYNKKIGLPIVKILVSSYNVQYGKATSKDISVQVVNTFRKEFGLDPEILNYYEGTKTSFVNNGVIANGNNMAFDMTDAGEYKGKPTITQNPSGDYTEVQWMSYNQILELVKTNSFDPSSLYYVLRSREQRRYTPIMSNKMKMRMYADKNGIKQHLNPADNTLFKTLNNNGLKIWEETEDYLIYIDKDAITTTVQQYVTGAFDRYLEMNRTIDSNISLLRSYNIEWTTQDKCKLFESINDSMLNELASQASNLGIEEPQPLVLGSKTVPIEYLCCFRVDKETKEFYVEEGYENIYQYMTFNYTGGNQNQIVQEEKDYYLITPTSLYNGNEFYFNLFPVSTDYHGKIIIKSEIPLTTTRTNYDRELLSFNNDIHIFNINKEKTTKVSWMGWDESYSNNRTLKINTTYKIYKKVLITKTSETKPYIQSIIPDCKITLNGIDPTTHTVLYKEPVSLYNDAPDDRMVLNLYADEKGLVCINNIDSMPINITGGKTLAECIVEETEDYIIYADGGTQVRMGRTGLGQKYIEALNTIYSEEIEKGSNILSPKHLTSEVQFHSHLLDVLNEEHNKEIEAAYEAQLKTRNVMAEEPCLEPLSEQRVFVAINFACRIDKNSGEIYIGEGYENLWNGKLYSLENREVEPGVWVRTKTKGRTFYLDNQSGANAYLTVIAKFDNGQKLIIPSSCDKISLTDYTNEYNYALYKENGLGTYKFETDKDVDIDERFYIRGIQVTKTSTPKPFVKSVMPSSKLTFVTGDISTTHSFVVKGIKTNGAGELWLFCNEYNANAVQLLMSYDGTKNDLLFNSNTFVNPVWRYIGNPTANGSFNIASKNRNSIYILNSFSQLLIYKGNLTEAELKAENNKNITLKNNQSRFNNTNTLSNGEYNVHTIVGRFKEILLYEGVLSEQEKQNELSKLDAISFEKPLDIVRNGLVCWLDGCDGKGTETTWVDRSGNGNNATVVNSNFDSNSGWTGKGIKFDGIDDKVGLYGNIQTSSEASLCFYLSSETSQSQKEKMICYGAGYLDNYIYINNTHFGVKIFGRSITDEGTRFEIPKGILEVYLCFVKESNKIHLYANGVLVRTVILQNLTEIATGITTLQNGLFFDYVFYPRALTESEIQYNYKYEQSIDRTTPVAYPLFQEEKSYGIGLASQLSEEQLGTFRLSIDKTKFVAGLGYCNELAVVEYTYSETLAIMDTEEWSVKEEA